MGTNGIAKDPVEAMWMGKSVFFSTKAVGPVVQGVLRWSSGLEMTGRRRVLAVASRRDGQFASSGSTPAGGVLWGVRLESMRDNRFNEVLSLTSGKVCA